MSVSMEICIPANRSELERIESAVYECLRANGWLEVLHTDQTMPSGVKDINGAIYVASFAMKFDYDCGGVKKLCISVTRAGTYSGPQQSLQLLNDLIRTVHRSLREQDENRSLMFPYSFSAACES